MLETHLADISVWIVWANARLLLTQGIEGQESRPYTKKWKHLTKKPFSKCSENFKLLVSRFACALLLTTKA